MNTVSQTARQKNTKPQIKFGRMRKVSIGHKQTKRQQFLFFIVSAMLFILSITQIDFSLSYFSTGISRAKQLFISLLQPDLSALPQFMAGLLQTLSIAFLGLSISVMITILLVFLVARNTTPNETLAKLIRAVLVVIRAVPITIWVLVAAASVGFGSLAGVLGLFFPTTAYLTRVLSNQIEENGNGIIEALKSCGASWIQVMYKGVFIQLLPVFLTTVTFRYELSVAESIILGMVGVAGIGYRLNMAIGTYNFNVAATGIILIYITMFSTELLSRKIAALIRR